MAESNDPAALGRLVTDLQVQGVVEPALEGNPGRRGGAGPSDHRALTFGGTTVMVPVYSARCPALPLPAQRAGGHPRCRRPHAGLRQQPPLQRWKPRRSRVSTASTPPMAPPTAPSPCCMAATCWPPPCCRPASASATAASRASSAPSSSRSRTAAPWCARPPPRWRRWPRRRCGSMACASW